VDNPAGDDLLAELRRAGERIVDALRDQVADGQAETLHSLSSAAHDLRQQLDQVLRAGQELSQATTAMTAEVGERVSALLTQGVEEGLREGRQGLADFAGQTAKAAADAHTAMEWAVSNGEDRLTEAAADLAEQRTQLEKALAAGGDALVKKVRAAAVTATELIQVEAADAVTLLEGAFATAQTFLVDSERATAARLAVLRQQVTAAERREGAVAERLQAQLDALVARLDATAGASLGRLEAVAESLALREQALEARRADEFVRVLSALLSEGGAGGRRLRDRLRRGIDTQRADAPARATAPARARATAPARAHARAHAPADAGAVARARARAADRPGRPEAGRHAPHDPRHEGPWQGSYQGSWQEGSCPEGRGDHQAPRLTDPRAPVRSPTAPPTAPAHEGVPCKPSSCAVAVAPGPTRSPSTYPSPCSRSRAGRCCSTWWRSSRGTA
jgi:hypothetical protein